MTPTPDIEYPSDASTPLTRWANEPFAYLTTFGRQSGNPHRIEIWFAVEDDTLYLLSGGRDRSDWVKNLQADPQVTIELGPETLSGVAEVIAPDSPEDANARKLLVQKYRTADELDDWGRTSLPIVIRFS